MADNNNTAAPKQRSPWFWIPSLYYAEGIPYVVVMSVAVIMFKRLGISNTDITLYTGWLNLPWVIKPLWSPIVDLLKTKRWWIVIMQLIIGTALGGIALAIPLPLFFKVTLIFMWLLAFSSATHDIAADGFYMLGLNEHQQAYFVGIRSTFYRLAMITGQGILIILAGFLETSTGMPPVEINATANPSFAKEIVLPEVPAAQESASGENYFVVYPSKAELSTQNITTAQLDSVKKIVSAHNLENGFVASQSGQGKNQGTENKTSWWTAHVSQPLKSFLKKHFGVKTPEVAANTLTGNVSVVAVKLSSKPEENKEMVLNLKFRKGDNSIRLID
jgi:PAT family beta-lactamase induction signal transducer AmpG